MSNGLSGIGMMKVSSSDCSAVKRPQATCSTVLSVHSPHSFVGADAAPNTHSLEVRKPPLFFFTFQGN